MSDRVLENGDFFIDVAELLLRLERIEGKVDSLVKQRLAKDYYSTAEVAEILGKKPWTVREWCRLGRIHATKRLTGRGNAFEWQISHDELERYQADGLLPLPDPFFRFKNIG